MGLIALMDLVLLVWTKESCTVLYHCLQVEGTTGFVLKFTYKAIKQNNLSLQKQFYIMGILDVKVKSLGGF